ncbi:MAG: helix-turn-helix domain-containing protein [Betaproteobacteria bacterium]|nr:helix-turn-helix domain-containing protein [Betaproteobacteria bacterium]
MFFTEAQLVAGRKPLGPALVERLDGSTSAKERLELILETLSGQVTVVGACQHLGISEAMFYKLRNRVLQVCLEDLEPKPRGRPPQPSSADSERSAELAAEVATLQRALAAQTVRLELAQQLPRLAKQPEPAKKTNWRTPRKKKQRRRK